MKLRDEIRAGNIAVEHSKRFGHLEDFFMPDEQWTWVRAGFFSRSKLPAAAEDVPAYFERRLGDAFVASSPLLPTTPTRRSTRMADTCRPTRPIG